jgi:hypothetical protein
MGLAWYKYIPYSSLNLEEYLILITTSIKELTVQKHISSVMLKM